MPNTTQGRLYLLDLVTRQRLSFQFIPELDHVRDANFASVNVVGRNTPQYHYVGGSSTVTLRLDFYSDEYSRQDVIRNLRWLESLCFSDTNQKPHKVTLIFGDYFRDGQYIVTKVRAQPSLYDPAANYLPRQMFVDVTLQLDPPINLTATQVRQF